MITTVLFDLGQVLVRWDPYQAFAGRHGPSEVDAFFQEIDFPAFNHLQDAGRTWADARAELSRTHPDHVAMLDVYTERFADSVIGEVPGASALVGDLVEAGIRVLGLSNWSAETFHVAGSKAPVVTMLEDVLVSGQVGLAKPDPRIFRLAVERFGLDPAETLFTDDVEGNVAAARADGFVAEVFTSTGALRDRLTGLGVALPR